MNDTTPRRQIVPGPSGIAARAVAMREEKTREVFADPPAPQPPAYTRFVAPLPVTGIGKIAGAIAGVMSEIGSIPKSGYNKFHNYHYATLPDLLHVLTPLMGRHGIAVFQTEVEIKTIENRMAVTYDFTVAHSSGETWPERLRFTGMSIGRDSKGSWDDKAVNKCHSAARKYFLLALFQVPTGDFEDADEGPAATPQQPIQKERAITEEKPKDIQRATSAKQPESPQRSRTVPGPPQVPEPVSPYKIIVPKGADAETWLNAYLKRIGEAKDRDEIAQLDHYNDLILQKLSNDHPVLYERIAAAVDQKLLDEPDVMPDPQTNTQDSMNWVAQKLLEMQTMEAAQIFWNNVVAPQEEMFDDMDWELLMQEWRRTEARLATPPDEPEAA